MGTIDRAEELLAALRAAPEQAEDARRADARSDLYSLGGTLYFALTGQVPFPGGSAIEKVLRHQAEDAAPIARLR
ncbi:MAG TPA: hypothetical protein VF590_20040, partial [Isosphaeraceae bacterium]